jgi:hypothetical protein
MKVWNRSFAFLSVPKSHNLSNSVLLIVGIFEVVFVVWLKPRLSVLQVARFFWFGFFTNTRGFLAGANFRCNSLKTWDPKRMEMFKHQIKALIKL